MTIVVIAAAIAAAAVVVGVVMGRRRPAGAPPNDELVRAVDEMRGKMDELAGELSGALERAELESRRNRLFGELGGSIDLEELMDRVLDAALEIPGIEAAMMVVERQDGAPAIVTRGMSADESARPPTSGVAGSLPGTITVSYRYGRDRDDVDADLIRGGAFIPLMGRELRPVGTLSLFWRAADHEPSSEEIDQAEHLAASCISAVENARRYGEARKLAETDALTGLFNQRFFQETLRREVTRAHRYQRKLTLIVFDLDDFKSINDQIGHLAGDRVLAQAADRLREAVRSVDVASRIGGDEFAVIMPESSAEDGEQLFRRVHNSMRGTALGPDEQRLRLSGGIAELLHGDTPASLFERADARALPREGARQGSCRHRSGKRSAYPILARDARTRRLTEQGDEATVRWSHATGRSRETMTRCFGRRRAGEEHCPLGSDEPGSSDRDGARRDDPRRVGLARCGAFEAASQDRRSAAAPDCENEPARPPKDDSLGTRFREERKNTSLSALEVGTHVCGRRACSTSGGCSRSTACRNHRCRAEHHRRDAGNDSENGERQRRRSACAVGTSTAHMLAVGEPTALSSANAGSWTVGMSGPVRHTRFNQRSGPVGTVVRRIA